MTRRISLLYEYMSVVVSIGVFGSCVRFSILVLVDIPCFSHDHTRYGGACILYIQTAAVGPPTESA